MRVLLSSCVHWWNAEAAYAATLGEALAEAGHEPWVWCRPGTANAAELARRGLRLVTDIPHAGNNPLDWLRTVRALRAFLARERVEVVDVFRSAEFPLVMHAARDGTARDGTARDGTARDGTARDGTAGEGTTPRGAVRVVRTRGTAQPARGHWLNRAIHRPAHGLIASSEVVRDQMCRALALPESRVRVIYYPTDVPPMLDEAARRAAKARLLAELGWEGGRRLLAIVGRLRPIKGHAELFSALHTVIEAVPEVGLVIFAKSDPEQDPEAARIRGLIARHGLEHHVRLTGFRDDLRDLLQVMEAGVVPSLGSEVNCRVAVECFSVGLPVVAFPTGALPEVVEHEVSGLVTPSHQPAALAAALIRLLQDAPLRGRLGAGAREQASGRFSRERFLAETLHVFQQGS